MGRKEESVGGIEMNLDKTGTSARYRGIGRASVGEIEGEKRRGTREGKTAKSRWREGESTRRETKEPSNLPFVRLSIRPAEII